MGITYGDHLIDSGYYDITPEQERETEAREECARRGIDPDELCADGGVEAWMVVDNETRDLLDRLRAGVPVAGETESGDELYDIDAAETTMAEAAAEIAPARQRAELIESLSNWLDPEIGFPDDDLLRRIHADIELRGRRDRAFAVSVHHRNIVLSAAANALRCSHLLRWDEWLEHCGWPRGSEPCNCYFPGDCDGSCTHPEPQP